MTDNQTTERVYEILVTRPVRTALSGFTSDVASVRITKAKGIANTRLPRIFAGAAGMDGSEKICVGAYLCQLFDSILSLPAHLRAAKFLEASAALRGIDIFGEGQAEKL